MFREYDVNELFSLPTQSEEEDYLGYVYLIATTNNFVKIGCTKDPIRRVMSVISSYITYNQAVDVSKVYLSEAHTNYRANEGLLHKLCAGKRCKGTEMFSMDPSDIMKQAGTLDYCKDSSGMGERDQESLQERIKELSETLGISLGINLPISVDNDEVCVSARDLHKSLDVKSRFSRWWDRNTKMLTNSVDYHISINGCSIVNGNGRLQMLDDFMLTPSAAKYIVMSSKGPAGDKVRRYFLAIERMVTFMHLPNIEREIVEGIK